MHHAFLCRLYERITGEERPLLSFVHVLDDRIYRNGIVFIRPGRMWEGGSHSLSCPKALQVFDIPLLPPPPSETGEHSPEAANYLGL